MDRLRNANTASLDPSELRISPMSLVTWTNGDSHRGYDLTVSTNPARGVIETLFTATLLHRQPPGHIAAFQFKNGGAIRVTLTTGVQGRGGGLTLWATMLITI
jgi:hypothetical protein